MAHRERSTTKPLYAYAPEYLQYEAVQRLAQSLDSAQSRSAEQSPAAAPANEDSIDLTAMLRAAACAFQKEIVNAGCTVDIQVQSPVCAAWDSTQLRQLSFSVMADSIARTQAGVVTISAWIEDRTAQIEVDSCAAPAQAPRPAEGDAVPNSCRRLQTRLDRVYEATQALGGTLFILGASARRLRYRIRLPLVRRRAA